MRKRARRLALMAACLVATAVAAEPNLADRASRLDRILRLREQYQTNALAAKEYGAYSNMWWAGPRVRALRESNTAIVDALVSLTNEISGDPVQISQILHLAAEQYFLEAPWERRARAFDLYERILTLDQEQLRQGSNLDSWEGRKSELDPVAFDRALVMDRYRLLTAPAFQEGPREEARWRAFYRGYHKYYTNGYVPAAEYRVNMGVFYLMEGDLRRARIAFDASRFADEDFWADRLMAAEFEKASEDSARWNWLARYLKDGRMRQALNVSPGFKLIQVAIASLSWRDPLGRDRMPTLEELPSDERVIQRALDLLERACRDPLAIGPARYNQGMIFLTLERWPNAVSSLEEALRHWPDPRAYYALALTELKLQNGPRAYRWFEELNRIAPRLGQEDPLFLNNFVCAAIGDTNMDVRRLSQSRIARAVELDDKNPALCLTRGELLSSIGDHQGATNQFRRALALVQAVNPDTYTNAMPWFRLKETNRVPQYLDEIHSRLKLLLGTRAK